MGTLELDGLFHCYLRVKSAGAGRRREKTGPGLSGLVVELERAIGVRRRARWGTLDRGRVIASRNPWVVSYVIERDQRLQVAGAKADTLADDVASGSV